MAAQLEAHQAVQQEEEEEELSEFTVRPQQHLQAALLAWMSSPTLAAPPQRLTSERLIASARNLLP